MIKKLIVYGLSLIVLILLTPPALAQVPTPSADPSTTLSTSSLRMGLPSNVNPTSPLYTDMLVHNMFHTFSCLAVGQSAIGQPCLTYQITKDAQGAIQGVPILSQVNLQGGALGTTTSLIGALYTNPPVRTADYLASVGQGLGIVKEANAQVVGSGANVLSPILTLWQVSRNISYLIMIIIFVIIGLMVMFRNRINPQTVITAQAALPGLVIGLILITFSYFLAGLISDMAFVGTNVVGYYFAAAQGPTALADSQRTNLAQHISGNSVLNIMGAFVGIASNHAGGIVDTIINAMPTDVATTIRVFIGLMGAQLISPIGGLTGPYSTIISPIAGLLGTVTGVLNVAGLRSYVISLVVTAILIYALLRLLFRLLNSYLTIIFLTVSAPFQFLFASLPGRQGIITGWIMSMLGNILVFPAVIAVFYFVAVLLSPIDPRLRESTFPLKVSGTNQIQDQAFPDIVYADEPIQVVDLDTFPLFGGMDLSFVRILLALAALIAVPAIPDIIIRTVGKASEAGQLISQELGGGIRSGQGYASQYGNRAIQTAQSMGTGITGESQWFLDREGRLARQTTRPGFWQVGGKVGGWLKGRTARGGID